MNKGQAKFVVNAVKKDITATESDEVIFRKLVYAMGDFVGCINELCENEMVDALGCLRQQKYFKQEIKMMANEAKHSLSLCVQRARASTKRRDVYLSYVDAFYEHYKDDVKQLYWSLRQVLTKNGMLGDVGDMLARLILVHNLLSTSVGVFDNLIKDGYNHCHVNFRECFADRYYVDRSFSIWKKMMQAVLGKHGTPEDININDSKECVLAYKIFYEKLRRGKHLNESALDSMAENYDSLDDEMREAYDNVVKAKLKEVEQ